MIQLSIIYKVLFAAWLLLAMSLYNCCVAQNIKVIKRSKTLEQQVTTDSNYKMVELQSLIPFIKYDIRYATTNNFTNQKLYSSGKTAFLRLPVANALLAIQNEMVKLNYSIKIFDAYRPYRVTKKMWELIKDEKYVANPAKGSGHNRGLSVDLTIIDKRTGQELDMGTGYDNFTDTAHHGFTRLSNTVLQNRQLLKNTMEKWGFKALETEWWHYSWPNDRHYDVLDIKQKKLK
jgi:D-alanyl-D-alanine dipeptidase